MVSEPRASGFKPGQGNRVDSYGVQDAAVRTCCELVRRVHRRGTHSNVLRIKKCVATGYLKMIEILNFNVRSIL